MPRRDGRRRARRPEDEERPRDEGAGGRLRVAARTGHRGEEREHRTGDEAGSAQVRGVLVERREAALRALGPFPEVLAVRDVGPAVLGRSTDVLRQPGGDVHRHHGERHRREDQQSGGFRRRPCASGVEGAKDRNDHRERQQGTAQGAEGEAQRDADAQRDGPDEHRRAGSQVPAMDRADGQPQPRQQAESREDADRRQRQIDTHREKRVLAS